MPYQRSAAAHCKAPPGAATLQSPLIAPSRFAVRSVHSMLDTATPPASSFVEGDDDAAAAAAKAAKAAAHAALKLEKRLVRQVAQAITDFGLIEDGDKVMVCVCLLYTSDAADE